MIGRVSVMQAIVTSSLLPSKGDQECVAISNEIENELGKLLFILCTQVYHIPWKRDEIMKCGEERGKSYLDRGSFSQKQAITLANAMVER